MKKASNSLKGKDKKHGLEGSQASEKYKFKPSLQDSLSEILSDLSRSRFLSTLLLSTHVLELISLSLPNEILFPSEFMRMLHSILLLFKLSTYKENVRLTLIICFTIINFSFTLTLLLLTLFRQKSFVIGKKFLTFLRKVCVNYFRVFIPIFLIPMTVLSTNELLNLTWAPEKKLISFLLLSSTFVASIFITSLQVNFSFSHQDYLLDFPKISDYGIIILKLAVCAISNQDSVALSYISVCLFAILLIDYCMRINYIDIYISQIYLFLLLIGFLLSLIYNLTIIGIINPNHLEPSLIVFLISPLILRATKFLRNKLVWAIIRKPHTEITDEGEVNLFCREMTSFLESSSTGLDIESRSEIMYLVNKHTLSCKDDLCICKVLNFSGDNEMKSVEEVVRVILKEVLIGCLTRKSSKNTGERGLLNFAAFLIDVEKSPNKALSYLFKNERKILSFSCQIGMKILDKRCKKVLEKKLKEMERVLENFSEVIEYECHVKNLDLKMKRFMTRYLHLFVRLQPNRHESQSVFVQFALQRGSVLFEEINLIKKTVLSVLDGNPENFRILNISKALNRIFPEDIEFINMTKRYENVRIQISRERKRAVFMETITSLDLFNPKAGVLFVNMSQRLGEVERASKGILELFQAPEREIVGTNIANFMPMDIGIKHDKLLMEFLETGKVALIRERSCTLLGIDKENNLININVILRIDTFFMDTFLVGALITKSQFYTKSLLCNEVGNILHLTEELDHSIKLKKLKKSSRGFLNNIIVLLPQLSENILDSEEDAMYCDLSDPGIQTELELVYFSPSIIKMEREQKRIKTPLNLLEKSSKQFAVTILDQTLANIETSQEIFSVKLAYSSKFYCRGQIKYIHLNFLEFSEIKEKDKIITIKKTYQDYLNLLRLKMIRNTTDKASIQLEINGEKGQNRRPSVTDGINFQLVGAGSLDELFAKTPPPKLYEIMSGKDQNVSVGQEAGGFSNALGNIYNSTKGGLLDDNPSQKMQTITPKSINDPQSFKNHSDKKNTFHLQSLIDKSEGVFGHISKLGKSDEIEEEEGEEIRGIQVFATRARSEGSSSMASSGSLNAIVYQMGSGRTRELRIFNITMLFITLSFIGLMFFSWNDYLTRADSIFNSMASSHVLQELILPLTFNVKNIVVKDFSKQGLFESDSTDAKDFWEYLNLSQINTKLSMKEAFSKKLRQGSDADDYLLAKDVNFIRSDYLTTIDKTKKYQDLDLDRGLSVLLTYIFDINEESSLIQNTEAKYSESLYFIFINFRSFIKCLIEILPEIDNSVTKTLNGIGNTNQMILYLYPGLLFLLICFLLRVSYKIKYDASRIAMALKQFDPSLIRRKIYEISSIFREMYPSHVHEIRNLVSTQEVIQNQRASLFQASSSSAKTTQSHPIDEKLFANNLKDKSAGAIYIKLSFSSIKFFVITTIIIMGFCMGLTVTVLIVNNFIIVDFEGKVSKVVATIGGIQQFMISFTAISTLKHVDYFFTLKKNWPEVGAERVLIKSYIDNLNQILKKNSNPMKILEKEDEFPTLLSINSNFYFSDICKILEDTEINIDFTQRFNSQTCPSILKGVMRRGSKGLVNEINSYFTTWDFYLAQTNQTSRVISEQILDTPEYTELHFALKLLQYLEDIELQKVIEVLNDYMATFHSNEDLWLSCTLVIITLTWIWVWVMLGLSLHKTFLNTVDLLKIVPSEMISSNKVLLSRIFELSRKV